MVNSGPKPDWTPIFSRFWSRLTTCMRLRRSLVWLELALSGDLRSLIHVVKPLPNWLKIGVQSGFGPRSTVEFVPVFQKKNLGRPTVQLLVGNNHIFSNIESLKMVYHDARVWRVFERLKRNAVVKDNQSSMKPSTRQGSLQFYAKYFLSYDLQSSIYETSSSRCFSHMLI